jgi:hypothetical protein
VLRSKIKIDFVGSSIGMSAGFAPRSAVDKVGGASELALPRLERRGDVVGSPDLKRQEVRPTQAEVQGRSYGVGH